MTDEGTHRPLHSDPIDGLNLLFSMSSGLSFGQLVLRLKTDSLPEDEQIAVLQQMIFFASRSDQDLRIAVESEGIEISSSLFTKTPNKRIKQFCIGLIGMIGQLGVEDEQKDDWIVLCIPLSKLLFSSDNELQRRGKNSLMNLIEQNENVVSGLLQIGFLDRSSDALNNIPSQSSSSSSSQTTITSSSSFVMNILTILDQIITIASEKISKSGKIIKTLDQLKKSGETAPIRRKAGQIQDLLEKEGQMIADSDSELQQLKEKIISLEDRIRIQDEQIRNKDERERILQQEKIDSDQQIIRLNQQIEAKENENRQVKSRLASSEERIQALEQQSHEKNTRINTLSQEKANIERQIQEQQEQINQNKNKIEILTKEKAQCEQRAITAEGQIRTLTIQNTQKDQSITSLIKDKKQAEDKASASEVCCKALEQEKVQKDEKIKTLNQEKTQKDLKIDALTKQQTQLEQKAGQLEGRIKTLEQDRKQLEEKSPATQKENLILMRKMNEISKRMNDLLKSMVNESDLEKLRMIPWIEMWKDLSKPVGIVCGQEGSIDLQRQIEICEYLIEMFKDIDKNDEYRKRCIQCGIAKSLVNMIENWKVEDIKEQHSQAFAKLTFTNNNEIKQLLFTLNPFKGLLNLLNHSNSIIQMYGITSIFNIQTGGSETTSDTEIHPYFDTIASIGGIEKIYEFMNRKNTTKQSKDASAIIIGFFFKARKIENVEMRTNVIKHLKTIVNDQNGWTKTCSRNALKYLAQNSDNKNEIDKDRFVIPT
ncbi:MAG: hypothetical protein EZS28_004438 [Streblomastix strix]|uniref:Uncharacterized protein n=1 Tax=Streblomastix strix TaxID=222440 RepID=A0A5J4WYU5_9EUKA|nr:MAG: hypothetical protein EZS28_004438 [Streblomastix strix]